MKKGTLIFLFLVAITSCKKNYRTVSPVEKPLVEAVYASGHVYPLHEYKIYAQIEGVVRSRLVQPGDTFAKGQLLISLQGDEQDIRLQQSANAMQLTEANAGPQLADLQSSMKSVESKFSNDSAMLQRYERMLQQQAVSQVEYDRIKLIYTTSKNELDAIRKRYLAKVNLVQLDVSNAKSQYALNVTGKGFYELKATAPGRMYAIYKEVGELVRRDELLAFAGDRDSFYLQLLVDEQDIARVKIGQEVEVKMDGFKNKIYKAVVTKVYPSLLEQTQSLRVDAVFVKYPEGLSAGLTAEANIIISKKANALVIPREAFVTPDSVRVEEMGTVKTIFVTTGAAGTEEVEVLSGLSKGSKVILPK